jgi:DNA (cytosine-5)-methyltransferase 1
MIAPCKQLDTRLDVVGLFAGIGGIELGLHRAGHRSVLLCELDSAAGRVLRARFPEVPLVRDVREIEALPPTDVVAAGFPCQDLSQAGKTAGIDGEQSSLVSEVFRLFASARPEPTWLVLENVPFMLQLQKGRAMHYLATQLNALGLRWAYRVVDTRSFGLPQRRQRVVLVASRKEDPRRVLFADEAGEPEARVRGTGSACGFYWTEGSTGLGWAVDAVPTLKGGSGVGIPSPPGVWMPNGAIATPDVRDAERLQGFPANWTRSAFAHGERRGTRWHLVGNAVSVPLFRWVGRRLSRPGRYQPRGDQAIRTDVSWPRAAWCEGGPVFGVSISCWPIRSKFRPLASFLRFPTRPLSARATQGFLRRAQASTLRFEAGFLDAVGAHLDAVCRTERVR